HDSNVQASFLRAECAAAASKGDHERAGLLGLGADSAAANVTRAAERRQQLEPVHEARTAWEQLTEATLRLAQAGDAELHRRGVLAEDDKLKSAEPEGIRYPGPTEEQQAEDAQEPPARAEAERRRMAALGLVKDHEADPDVSAQLAEAAEHARQQRE